MHYTPCAILVAFTCILSDGNSTLGISGTTSHPFHIKEREGHCKKDFRFWARTWESPGRYICLTLRQNFTLSWGPWIHGRIYFLQPFAEATVLTTLTALDVSSFLFSQCLCLSFIFNRTQFCFPIPNNPAFFSALKLCRILPNLMVWTEVPKSMEELTPKATEGGNVELSVPTKQHPVYKIIWVTLIISFEVEHKRRQEFSFTESRVRTHSTMVQLASNLSPTPLLCTGLPVHCQSDSNRLESHWGWTPPYMQQLLNPEAEIIGYWYCSILFKGMWWSPALA